MKAEEIKRIRQKLGMTQSEAAKLFGFSSSTVMSNVETGFRKPNRLTKGLLSLLDSLPIEQAKTLARQLVKQNEKFL